MPSPNEQLLQELIDALQVLAVISGHLRRAAGEVLDVARAEQVLVDGNRGACERGDRDEIVITQQVLHMPEEPRASEVRPPVTRPGTPPPRPRPARRGPRPAPRR